MQEGMGRPRALYGADGLVTSDCTFRASEFYWLAAVFEHVGIHEANFRSMDGGYRLSVPARDCFLAMRLGAEVRWNADDWNNLADQIQRAREAGDRRRAGRIARRLQESLEATALRAEQEPPSPADAPHFAPRELGSFIAAIGKQTSF